MKIVCCHHQFQSNFRFDMKLSFLATGILQGPIKVLANFLQNWGANFWKSDFSKCCFRETPCRREHIFQGIWHKSCLPINNEFETLCANEFDCVLLPHFAAFRSWEEGRRDCTPSNWRIRSPPNWILLPASAGNVRELGNYRFLDRIDGRAKEIPSRIISNEMRKGAELLNMGMIY